MSIIVIHTNFGYIWIHTKLKEFYYIQFHNTVSFYTHYISSRLEEHKNGFVSHRYIKKQHMKFLIWLFFYKDGYCYFI